MKLELNLQHGNPFLFLIFIIGCFNMAPAQDFIRVTDVSNPIVSDNNEDYYVGCSWVDIDNDNDLDLFVPNRAPGRNTRGTFLYENDGKGNFTKISGGNLTNAFSFWFGTSWADYDNDGDLDCFIAGLPSRLYKNMGDGVFTPVFAGVIGSSTLGGMGAGWADYDNDGYVDLLLVWPNWLQGPPTVGPPTPPRLLKNDGPPNFTFTEIQSTVLRSGGQASYLQPSWYDYDDDGDVDLFIGTGGGTPAADNLFRNLLSETGSPGFERITDAPIATDLIVGGNWNWIDIDNDGDLDAYETNWAQPVPDARPNNLYRNDNGTFVRVLTGEIVTDADVSENNVWGDLDNDGDLDCIVVNDSLFALRHYKNNGDGTFQRVNEGELATGDFHQCGATLGDYDNDGDLDLFIVGANSDRTLFRNDLTQGNWLKLKLVGMTSNKTGIGAKVRVKAGINGNAIWQRRDLSASNSFFGHNSLNIHFGLADAAVVDSLIIEWPLGVIDSYSELEINRFYEVIEGQGLQEIVTSIREETGFIPDHFQLLGNYPNPFNPATTITYALSKPSRVTLKIYNIIGGEVTILIDEMQEIGEHSVVWNGKDNKGSLVSSGVYLYKIEANGQIENSKMLLMK